MNTPEKKHDIKGQNAHLWYFVLDCAETVRKNDRYFNECKDFLCDPVVTWSKDQLKKVIDCASRIRKNEVEKLKSL